jgi:hypothetical protein
MGVIENRPAAAASSSPTDHSFSDEARALDWKRRSERIVR